MTKYGRRKDSDTWHWCRNCYLDPKQVYVSQTSKPTTGELCNHCLAKEKDKNCNK